MTVPHPISEHCHIHDRHEPDLPDDYQVCGECGHVWRTAEEFRADVFTLHSAIGLDTPDDLGEIFACPLCTHDF